MGMGVSLFLIAVGGILAFAVQVATDGINLDTVGVILIILGLIGLLASLVFWDEWTPRQSALRYDDEADVVDIAEQRPVVERRRVVTRRTIDGGF